MQVFGKTKLVKIGLLCFSLPVSVLMVWGSLYAENSLIFVFCLGIVIFAVFSTVTAFTDKLVLGEDYIESKSLIRRKLIPFNEIVSIAADDFEAFVKSHKTKIRIGRDTENFSKVIGMVLMKLEKNQKVLIEGNLVAISCHIAEAESSVASKQVSDRSLRLPPVLVKTVLVDKGWLYRVVRLDTTDGPHEVIYYGRGFDYECVFVDGKVVSKSKSVFWHTPEFRFQVGSMDVAVNVRVWPWFTIRKFWIDINGKTVYTDVSV